MEQVDGEDAAAPALLLLSDRSEEFGALDTTLRCRYGEEYQLLCEASAAYALDRLDRLRSEGRPLAIVLTPASTIDTSGNEVFTREDGNHGRHGCRRPVRRDRRRARPHSGSPSSVQRDDHGFLLSGSTRRPPSRWRDRRSGWKPACRACSPRETCARARRSG